MTIPASVSTAITSLLSAVTAASPLSSASIFTLSDLQQQANSIIGLIDGALLADDTDIIAPPFYTAQQFATDVLTVTALVEEETALAEMAALVGRAAVNLANAGV